MYIIEYFVHTSKEDLKFYVPIISLMSYEILHIP